jgi:formate dehydrogenase iron-sulfur subunit
MTASASCQRLGAGEAPACAQACPTHAIKIVKVAVTLSSSPRADTSAFLTSAPDPSYTQPTTRYVSKRPKPKDTHAADAALLRPQPPHWPLVALLTLMPMAVGCGVAELMHDLPTPALAVTGWIAGAGGLALAALHLGQPLRAWRVFLGLRKSWFSREAVLFGLWFPVVTAYVAARLGWLPLPSSQLLPALAGAAAALGLTALFCSAMIYADTRRAFWRFANTAPRFFGSAIILGLAATLAIPGTPAAWGFGLVLATALKLAFEARALAPLREEDDGLNSPARLTARLLTGPLREANALRLGTALFGGILLPLMIALGAASPVVAWPALALCLGGELAERYLFFRAVDAPKMPGQPDPTKGGHA